MKRAEANAQIMGREYIGDVMPVKAPEPTPSKPVKAAPVKKKAPKKAAKKK